MIIKLQDGDVLTAQDDSEYEGVIHIPDNIWNHIIKEVDHSDQEWVNSLYIDVSDIEIGGSGLPVVASFFKIGNDYSGYTYDTTKIHHKPAGQEETINIAVGNAFFMICINENGTGNNGISYFVNNSSTASQITLGSTNTWYYYQSPGPVSVNAPRLTFYDDNNNPVIELSDTNYYDKNYNVVIVNSGIIDFLWLTP